MKDDHKSRNGTSSPWRYHVVTDPSGKQNLVHGPIPPAWERASRQQTTVPTAPPEAPHQPTIVPGEKSWKGRFQRVVVFSVITLGVWGGLHTANDNIGAYKEKKILQSFTTSAKAGKEIAENHYMSSKERNIPFPGYRAEDSVPSDVAYLMLAGESADFFKEMKTLPSFLQTPHSNPVVQENVDAFKGAAHAIKRMKDPIAKLAGAAGFACMNLYSYAKSDADERFLGRPAALLGTSWTASVQDMLKAGARGKEKGEELSDAMVCIDFAAMTGAALVEGGFSKKDVYILGFRYKNPQTGETSGHAVAAAKVGKRIVIIDNLSNSGNKGVTLHGQFTHVSRNNVFDSTDYFAPDSGYTLISAVNMAGDAVFFGKNAYQKGRLYKPPAPYAFSKHDQDLLNEVGVYASIFAVNAGVPCFETSHSRHVATTLGNKMGLLNSSFDISTKPFGKKKAIATLKHAVKRARQRDAAKFTIQNAIDKARMKYYALQDALAQKPTKPSGKSSPMTPKNG